MIRRHFKVYCFRRKYIYVRFVSYKLELISTFDSIRRSLVFELIECVICIFFSLQYEFHKMVDGNNMSTYHFKKRTINDK